MRQWIVFCGTLSLFGCAGLNQIVPAEPRSENVPAPVTFDGPECAQLTGDFQKDALLVRICPSPEPKRIAASDAIAQRTFDDRHPNLVTAAILTFDGARVGHDWAALGVSTYYAEILEPTALRAQLGHVDLSQGARDAFFNAVIDAKNVVKKRADQLDARGTRMYVETPHKVIAKRAEYFKSHAAEYQKLDELETRAVEARKAHTEKSVGANEIAPRLSALRGDYLAKCEGGDCRFDPLPIEVTRELASLYAAMGDAFLAQAENSLLDEPTAGRHLFTAEVGAGIYESMSEEKRFGTPPLKATPSSDWLIAASLLPTSDAAKSEVGVVRVVSPTAKRGVHGEALSQITFQSDDARAATCSDDGKIMGVQFDAANHAHVDYEVACGASSSTVATQPIFVPTDEAKWVKPGEILVALVSSDKQTGVVLKSFGPGSAKAKSPVLQVRGERTGAQAAAREEEEEAATALAAKDASPANTKAAKAAKPTRDSAKAKRKSDSKDK